MVQRNPQYTFVTRWTFFALFVATALNGAQADSCKDICPNEKVQVVHPELESAIKSGIYEELTCTVTDPKTQLKVPIFFCYGNVNCTRYSQIGSFEKRIEIISDPVRGIPYVKLLIKDDLLTFTCSIERKQYTAPLVYPVNVSSSVKCLSAVAGQDLPLNQASDEIQDMFCHRIKPDGKMQKILYFNSTAARLFRACNNSCPQWLPRLKMDGMTFILMNVTEEDRGLELQCRMYPKLIGRMDTTPMPQVYTIKIKDVFPSDSFSSTNTTTAEMPTSNSTGRVNGTQSSAGGRVLAFTVVVFSLVMALYEIS